MSYHQLTQTKRIEIASLKRLGLSSRAIARHLGCSHSTVSRELSRHAWDNLVGYDALRARLLLAHKRLQANQSKRKLPTNENLVGLIVAKLTLEQWSPDQIARWLKLSGQRVTVCVQTIYDWLYTRRKDLLKHLRSQKQHYRHTRAHTLRRQRRNAAFERRRISHRPKGVENRRFYGHWEGDTMVSSQSHGRIGTLVERKSGYLRAFLLPNGASDGFARASARALQGIPAQYLRTITLDNGTEMQSYELLERLTPLQVYFAYPYHSWERGTNENTNGLLRQYFPKRSDLSKITAAELDRVVRLLNTRPRKRLGYKTPEQVFTRKWCSSK